MTGIRRFPFGQLDSSAWPREGLSPVNRLMATLLILTIFVVVMETETTMHDAHKKVIDCIDLACGVTFAAEYFIRIWVAGERVEYRGIAGRCKYISSPLALIDLIAIVPFFISFVGNDLFLLRLAHLFRIVSLAKFGRYSVAVRNFAAVLRSRRYELSISLVAVLVVLLVSASLMYAVEGPSQPEEFGSIPRALWWAVVTLTTVGYGDVYPKTVLGKFCCAGTAIVSIGLLAMPTAILAAAFSEAFTRQDRNDEERMEIQASIDSAGYEHRPRSEL